MQRMAAFLWFDNQAKEAVDFYLSVFKDSKVLKTTYYGDGLPIPKGTVMSINFMVNGYEFIAYNSGMQKTSSSTVSFVIDCTTQKEIDELWSKLSDGGEELQCGWIKDKFGITWQILPVEVHDMLGDKDLLKSQRVLAALFQMKKINKKVLERAYCL